MIIIETAGISMRPLLITGDLVTVIDDHIKNQSIPFGTLVYATTINQEKVIHRYLMTNKIKGDRVKNLDQIITIDGIVKSRIENGQEIALNGTCQRYCLGTLSYLNQRKFVFVHHMAAATIEVLGKVLR